MGALLVATLLAALLTACPESTRVDPAASILPLRPLVPDDARIVDDRAHALSVALPPGWIRSRESLLPGLALPESSILTIATFPAHAAPHRACGDWPDMPQVAIGPRDALLHVEEELDAQPGSQPRRPRRLRLQEQLRIPRLNEPVSSVFPWRCLNRPGIVGLRTSFRAHGRLLHLTAVAGERTSTRRRRELLGVLASLRFGPPAPVAVRRERGYWAVVHGPLRSACVIENDAWFSDGPPGARVRAVRPRVHATRRSLPLHRSLSARP